MALRMFSVTSVTPSATADTTNLADTTYVGLVQGGTATQRVRIEEIYMGGQAGASAPTYMLLARDSTVAVTVSGGFDAALDPSTAALANPVLVGNTTSTKPQRSSTLHLMNLSFNAFGGLVRWNASPNEYDLALLGNTASLGEMSLSAFTGGTPGAMGSHIVYEPK